MKEVVKLIMEKMRVRYAPSPTGLLHIGNARTAIFNYIFARHYGAKFVIRIEDTDKAREVEGGEASQLENLSWLGVGWDESPRDPNSQYAPYRQSERLAIYHDYALQLVKEGKAYYSYMTKEELTAEHEAQIAAGHLPKHLYEYEGMTEEEIQVSQEIAKKKGIKPAIRIHVPEDHIYEWEDLVKGKISYIGRNIGGGDWVIEKADGTATYNFCVVVDDHLMEITHVIRGDDHVNNTPKQLMIYEAFGWKIPKMAHMPLVLNANTGKKLSKRDKNTLQFIEDYREKGFLPEAVFNFISLLGWNPGDNEEILSQEEIIKLFEIERMSGAPAAFDQSKLNWINQQYIKKMSANECFEFCRPFLEKAGRISKNLNKEEKECIKQIVKLYQPQLQYGEQIVELTNIFFEERVMLTEKERTIISTQASKHVIQLFNEKLSHVVEKEFTSKKILGLVSEIQKETGIKGKGLWMPLRIAISRQEHGPELDQFIFLIGLDKTLAHIQRTLKEI